MQGTLSVAGYDLLTS